MKTAPTVWMPIHISDHLAETSDFTATEQGAYFMLLCRLWRSDGMLPADDAQLARICRLSLKEWGKIKGPVMALFRRDNGAWVHDRLALELDKAKANIEKRRRAGIASGKARRSEHMFNTCSTNVEPRAGEGEGDAVGIVSLSRVRTREAWGGE